MYAYLVSTSVHQVTSSVITHQRQLLQSQPASFSNVEQVTPRRLYIWQSQEVPKQLETSEHVVLMGGGVVNGTTDAAIRLCFMFIAEIFEWQSTSLYVCIYNNSLSLSLSLFIYIYIYNNSPGSDQQPRECNSYARTKIEMLTPLVDVATCVGLPGQRIACAKKVQGGENSTYVRAG